MVFSMKQTIQRAWGYPHDYGNPCIVVDSNTGWWFQPTPLKINGVRQWVSDDIPLKVWKILENNIAMFQTTKPNRMVMPFILPPWQKLLSDVRRGQGWPWKIWKRWSTCRATEATELQ
jgi:hypothetical protein